MELSAAEEEGERTQRFRELESTGEDLQWGGVRETSDLGRLTQKE